MGKMGLGQIIPNLCNCVSRTLTQTIDPLRDYLNNLGRRLMVTSVCTMRGYKYARAIECKC